MSAQHFLVQHRSTSLAERERMRAKGQASLEARGDAATLERWPRVWQAHDKQQSAAERIALNCRNEADRHQGTHSIGETKRWRSLAAASKRSIFVADVFVVLVFMTRESVVYDEMQSRLGRTWRRDNNQPGGRYE